MVIKASASVEDAESGIDADLEQLAQDQIAAAITGFLEADLDYRNGGGRVNHSARPR